MRIATTVGVSLCVQMIISLCNPALSPIVLFRIKLVAQLRTHKLVENEKAAVIFP